MSRATRTKEPVAVGGRSVLWSPSFRKLFRSGYRRQASTVGGFPFSTPFACMRRYWIFIKTLRAYLMNHPFPIRLLIATPRGPVVLDQNNTGIPLPRNDSLPSPTVRYGPYLESLHECLSKNGYDLLLKALGSHLRTPVNLLDLTALHITSEKHGALYHVARLQVQLGQRRASFALNVALSLEQQAFVESDMSVLEELHDKFHLPHLPRVYFQDEALYREAELPPLSMRLFVAEWFEGHHEFHLSIPHRGTEPRIVAWEENGKNVWLTEPQTLDLYRRASAILTACLDTEDFRQVYPWHHAAGDFIVKREENDVSVKLITARDYRCITPHAVADGDRWIGIVFFFLNLTMRMRLDRLNGTGALAWADSSCLGAVLDGFLHSWAEKHGANPSLPSPGKVIEVLRSFTVEEWESMGGVVVKQGMVEQDEAPFLNAVLSGHTMELVCAILKATGP